VLERPDVGVPAAIEGIALADLAATVELGKLSLGWFGGILPPVPEVEGRTFREAIGNADLPTDLVEQLFTLWGIAVPPADVPIRADDAAIVGHVGRVFRAFGGDTSLLLASAPLRRQHAPGSPITDGLLPARSDRVTVGLGRLPA